MYKYYLKKKFGKWCTIFFLTSHTGTDHTCPPSGGGKHVHSPPTPSASTSNPFSSLISHAS